MPRANRVSAPGYVWHLTHRCHKREFLLKFARDRRCWMRWLYEARKRYGLCVLDYTVTCNHIHLLVRDNGFGEVAKSVQLVSGRTAQQYNRRKGRMGAFWEDRYHATAVQNGEHLARCLVYIDLNMVRAGVVSHPGEWPHGGYRELLESRSRYRIIDVGALMSLTGFATIADLGRAHARMLDAQLDDAQARRDDAWTKSVAVGSQAFVEGVKRDLGIRAFAREVEAQGERCVLKEEAAAYAPEIGLEMGRLSPITVLNSE